MIVNPSVLMTSAMYVGYHILKEIQKHNEEKVSIYDISKALKLAGMRGSRLLIMGLSFLYSVDIIDFEEAMVWVKK